MLLLSVKIKNVKSITVAIFFSCSDYETSGTENCNCCEESAKASGTKLSDVFIGTIRDYGRKDVNFLKYLIYQMELKLILLAVI